MPHFFIQVTPAADVPDTGYPIEVPLPAGVQIQNRKRLVLTYRWAETQKPIPFQIIGASSGRERLVFLDSPSLKKRKRVEYSFLPLVQPKTSPFRFEDHTGKTLDLFENDQLIFGYNYGEILAPGVPEDRRRSSYIHPVVGLDGDILSADFPKDHYHHRGLFWTWPRVGFEGRIVDQWHLDGARQRFERWETRETGSVCAVLAVKNGWFTNDGKKIVSEKVTITAFRAGAIGRTLDIDLQLAATTGPVTVAGRETEGKGYGGFCFRPASHRNEVITTINGAQQDSNLIPSPWGDFSAHFGKGTHISGLAIFQHHENPLFPSGWCLRHYGFLGVDFPGLEPFELHPGKPLHLRYRVWIHRGNAQNGKAQEMYEAFLRPPRTEVVAK